MFYDVRDLGVPSAATFTQTVLVHTGPVELPIRYLAPLLYPGYR